jgi:hypothetical protein
MDRNLESAAASDRALPQRLISRDHGNPRLVHRLRTIEMWDEYFYCRPRTRRSLWSNAPKN